METELSNNKYSVFTNDQFGNIRVIERNGEPWFVGKDVAEILGYKETQKAIREHVDIEDKGVSKMDTPGGKQELVIINESGVYSLILSSKLPGAKNFKRWITSEVIPSIRKHGAYLTPETMGKILTDPDFGIRLLQALKDEQTKVKSLEATVATQTRKISEMEPKARYCDIVLNSPSLVKTSIIAKDYGMTAQMFNKLLNEFGVQYRQGNIWLLYKKYQDKGYASTETFCYSNGYTNMMETQCITKWTQKGRLFLYASIRNVQSTTVCGIRRI